MTVSLPTPRNPAVLLLAWCAVAVPLLALAGLFVASRRRFDWALELADVPALPLMAGLIAAGVVFLAVLPLIRASEAASPRTERRLLALVLAVGLALRLMMFGTEPALEDDQQRYLFEGAMTAHGLSPYHHAPQDAKSADRASPLGKLAQASGPVIDRINHAALKSIYPPVAQAAFALSYSISPFSLTAWRLVLLGCEAATAVLILWLLREVGRSPLWSALYLWNPLLIKEVMNSGHMEAVLMALVIGAVCLAARSRPVAAAGVLGLAAGVKVWPVLFAPLLLRPLSSRPRVALAAGLLLGAMCVLWALPIVAGGLDDRSGFVAYAQRWQANGALLPALRGMVGKVMDLLGFQIDGAGRVARGILAASAAAAALAIARRPLAGTADLVQRAALLTLVVVLLSPAQFPWYTIWTLPFLPFVPRLGVMAMAVTLPVYYSSFYFSAIDAFAVFRDRVVWVVWLPVWALLAWEAARARMARTGAAGQRRE